MRRLGLLLAALAAGTFLQGAYAQDAHTTRIETRPYYGAVVTIEHGVRVFRPVPPTQHMIINPDGKTPLVMSSDGNVRVERNGPNLITKVPQGR